MSKMIDRIRKRNKWPVKLGADTVYIRAMVKGEQRESREITDANDPAAADELRGYFIFGVILIEDDGSPAFPRVAGESAAEFATRVDGEMADVPEDHKMAILYELKKIHSLPENLAKN